MRPCQCQNQLWKIKSLIRSERISIFHELSHMLISSGHFQVGNTPGTFNVWARQDFCALHRAIFSGWADERGHLVPVSGLCRTRPRDDDIGHGLRQRPEHLPLNTASIKHHPPDRLSQTPHRTQPLHLYAGYGATTASLALRNMDRCDRRAERVLYFEGLVFAVCE